MVCIPPPADELGQNRNCIWFGSRAQLAQLTVHDCSLQIGAETVQPASAARVLGVLLDSELTMKSHIAGTASACFYHLRRLRQIRRRVGEDVAVRLVLALITSRLDYCNSCLAGLPKSALDPLQRVQNAAARRIFQLGPRDHVTPKLIQLHWLSVRLSAVQVVPAHAPHTLQSSSSLPDGQCTSDVRQNEA
jgi:hypothetical protein